MMRRALHVALLLVVAACSDSNSPLRGDFYEWRLIETSATGAPDTLSFAWPVSRLPVRIWAQDSLGLPTRMQAAINTWQDQFLYGEFRGEMVSDSTTADIIVIAGPATGTAPTLRAMARQCQGATDIAVDPATFTLTPPMRIYIEVRLEDSAGLDDCLNLTSAHELGHAIGIFQHSPDPDDLMYSDPIVLAPSVRDRNTANRAYHTPTTIHLGGGS